MHEKVSTNLNFVEREKKILSPTELGKVVTELLNFHIKEKNL